MEDDNVLICVFPERRALVYTSVDAERDRQEEIWGPQTHPDGTTQEYKSVADAYRESCNQAANKNELTWHDILLEEVFEAMSEEDPEALETELIQVIAVAVDWVEDLRRRRGQ
jgi:hypothetical protein